MGRQRTKLRWIDHGDPRIREPMRGFRDRPEKPHGSGKLLRLRIARLDRKKVALLQIGHHRLQRAPIARNAAKSVHESAKLSGPSPPISAKPKSICQSNTLDAKAENTNPVNDSQRRGRRCLPPTGAVSVRRAQRPPCPTPRRQGGPVTARDPPAGCSAPRRSRRASTYHPDRLPQTAHPALRDRRAHRRRPDRPGLPHRSA